MQYAVLSIGDHFKKIIPEWTSLGNRQRISDQNGFAARNDYRKH